MKLLIAGAGGHGRVVADAAQAIGTWSEIAFLDDRYPQSAKTGPWDIVGRLADLPAFAAAYSSCLAAFGDARLRLEVLQRARALGFNLPTLIHPRAVVSPQAHLGEGVVVFAGCVVNIGAQLQSGCIVNTGATIDHDCRLAEGVHVCPGVHVAGDVSIGPRSWIGIGAAIKQGIDIGADVTVGAGAVCIEDIRDGVTVIGVPAKERNL